jgi:hypothetical protein
MRKILLFLCLAIVSISTKGQSVAAENVPAGVLGTFKSMFSIAEKVKWEIDYENYSADFMVGKSAYSATFDKDGKWMSTETFIKPSDLPKAAKDALLKEFGELSAYKMENAEKVEMPDKPVQYELDVEKGEILFEMVLSETGEILKKIEKKEKDEKENRYAD